MRKVIAGTFVSLDGVMQAPGAPEEDPTGGFKFGGWTAPHWDDVMGAALGEGFAQRFDLLIGRKTYDIFAAHWPYVQADPVGAGYNEGDAQIAGLFNSITKYVATHSDKPLTWQNSQSLGKDVPAAVRALKKGTGPDLLIQGSSNLVQTLLAHDLIDEFRLMIFPVVLGKGKRLFGDGTTPAAFKVTKSVVSTSGVVVITYERAGDVQTGSFALNEPSPAELERRRNLK